MNHANELEQYYRQTLEQRIIETLAEQKNIDLRLSTEIYYKSKLSRQISAGEYGIQYLDPRVLVNDLIENEPELFFSLK